MTTRGFYVNGTGDNITAFVKEKPANSSFTVHLAMHPQVCIQNLNRKRYLHLDGSKSKITCDENAPWGDDSVLTLDFFQDGCYGIMASNGGYLSQDGSLVQCTRENASADVKFVLEFHGFQLAFRSSTTGRYLACMGGDGTTKAIKAAATSKDSLFILEDSHPQLKMTSWQGKKVSVRGGIEVAANQADTTDDEIFQLEHFEGKWRFLSNKIKYWRVDDGKVKADLAADQASDPSCLFEVEWHGAKLAVKAANGKYVQVQKNKQLAASSDACSDECMFVYELVNRPRLILRGEHGFIGSLGNGTLQCNKSPAQRATFTMHVSKGVCQIQGANGKYWAVNGDRSAISLTGSDPTPLTLAFVADSEFAIQYEDDDGVHYLCGQQTGELHFNGRDINKATRWEF